MPQNIFGNMIVKGGEKQTTLNFSNARYKTNAQWQQMSDAQKKGVVVVEDYPIPEESDSVSVTADGVKTWETLLGELFTSADLSKITQTSLIVVKFSYGEFYYRCDLKQDDYGEIWFSVTTATNSGMQLERLRRGDSGNNYYRTIYESTGTVTDESSIAVTNGATITLIYDYYKNLDIHTEYLAKNCILTGGGNVEDKLNDIVANNAGAHNAIYRGKYLGSSVTADQWSAISNGTFEDLYVGDYWTINSVNWRIAHFDYWLDTGNVPFTSHHAVIVPDTCLYDAKMNDTGTTAGGYYYSKMRGGDNYMVENSSELYPAAIQAVNAFGVSHVPAHRELITNTVTSGNASNWAWYDSSLDLMNEVMVYGTLAFSVGGKGFEVGSGKGQFALFRHDISKVTNNADWWLRSVSSATNFALVDHAGNANPGDASLSLGVRPCFAIK